MEKPVYNYIYNQLEKLPAKFKAKLIYDLTQDLEIEYGEEIQLDELLIKKAILAEKVLN